MKEMSFSPISIDLGAAHTGVQYVHGTLTKDNFKIDKNIGECLDFYTKKITFLQRNRLTTRHRVRGLKRRKFAKRLIFSFFSSKGVEYAPYKKAIDFTNGLLNRRGFTFTVENLDDSFEDKGLSKVFFEDVLEIDTKGTVREYFLNGMQTIGSEQLKDWISSLEEYKNDLVDRVLENDQDRDKKEVGVFFDKVKTYLEGVRDDREKGAQHRSVYFDNIKKDIDLCLKSGLDEKSRSANNYGLSKNLQELLDKIGMSKEEFGNFICNVSNLQLRTLRKYFNDESFQQSLQWDEQRLSLLIARSIVSWHCSDTSDKDRRKDLLSTFEFKPKTVKKRRYVLIPDYEDSIVQWLCGIDPKRTIPPYEDQNNRRPPKCTTLYLNPTGLDTIYPEWEETVNLFVQEMVKKESIAQGQMMYEYEGRDFHVDEIKSPACKRKNNEDKKSNKKSSYSSPLRPAKWGKYLLDESSRAEERLKQARVLQRILDMSGRLDVYRIREIVGDMKAKKKDDESKKTKEKEVEINLKENLINLFNKNESKFKGFLEFATHYYEQVDFDKRGMWNEPDTEKEEEGKEEARNNLFYQCGNNPPRKDKVIHELINNLLGTSISDIEAVEDFRKKCWGQKKVTGNLTYKGFAKKVEEISKQYGNSFKKCVVGAYFALYKNKYELVDKEEEKSVVDEKLEDIIEPFMEKGKKQMKDLFENFNKYFRDKGGNGISNNPNTIWDYIDQLYILTPMYNLLEKDSKGFSKDCQWCVEENAWRMKQVIVGKPLAEGDDWSHIRSVSHAVRLHKNTVRPFDGFLARYFQRIAQEIANKKIEQLSDVKEKNIYVPILIEQNKFEFEEGLGALRESQGGKEGKKKNDSNSTDEKREKEDARREEEKDERIKQDTKRLCPYCGKNLDTSVEKEQREHIISRSYSLERYATVFNSEANLVFACRDCNVQKGKDPYTLNNLNLKYLLARFGTDDIQAIEQEIKRVLEGDEKRESILKRNIISFKSLEANERMAIRHGLFLAEFRDKILQLINFRTKTMVNGTQAYLAKLIRKKLIQEGKKIGKDIKSAPFQIPVTSAFYKQKETSNEQEKKEDSVPPTPVYIEQKETSNEQEKKDWISKYALESMGVSTTRKLLGSKYEKVEPQDSSSHIVDASMVLGTVLRSDSLLYQVLKLSGDSIFSEKKDSKKIVGIYNQEDNRNLISIIPDDLTSKKLLKRRKMKDNSMIWEKGMYQSTIYGEQFYPLILEVEGSLSFGYIDPSGSTHTQCSPIESSKDYSYEDLFSLLVPYLLRNKRLLTKSYQEYKDSLHKKPMFFTISKQKCFQFYEDVFYSRNGYELLNLNEDTKKTIELLESLRFVFIKQEVQYIKEKEKSNLFFQYQKKVREEVKQIVYDEFQNIFDEQKKLYTNALLFILEKGLYEKDVNDSSLKQYQDQLKQIEKQCFFGGVFKYGKLKTQKDIQKMISSIEVKKEKTQKILKGNENEKEKKITNIVSSSFLLQVNTRVLKKRKKNEILVRKHKVKPTRVSIKYKPTTFSGTLLRIRRKGVGDNVIYQVVVGGENSKGVVITQGIDKNTKKPVLLDALTKNKNVVPCKLCEWVPYDTTGVSFEQEKIDTSPVNLEEIPNSDIEKIVCDRSNKKFDQWKLSLYFSKKKYHAFRKSVESDKSKETSTDKDIISDFKAEPKLFISYLGGDISNASSESIGIGVKVVINKNIDNYIVATFSNQPACISNCFSSLKALKPPNKKKHKC